MRLLWSLFSFLFAYVLATRGLRKRSLSESGAIAAFVVGIIHMYGGVSFGVVMTAFYLSSTKLTKYKAELKRAIEENYNKASERNAWQVLACSLTSSVLVVLYWYNQGGDPRLLDAFSAGILGHFACCCADTWSSEVGVVAHENPILITTFKVVPKGTNGAISKQGTAAGAAGGLFMGAVFWLTLKFFGEADSKLGINLILMGLVFGVLGTLLDSILGGTLQYTGHSRKTNRVVNYPGPDVTHLAGSHILSNEAVNFVSSLGVAALAGYWGYSRHA